ncbi:hypothetical protein D3C80_2170910 [compost metagenome]
MASNLPAISAGIIPSQSWMVQVQRACSWAQSALPMSTSKPLGLPSGPISLKGA